MLVLFHSCDGVLLCRSNADDFRFARVSVSLALRFLSSNSHIYFIGASMASTQLRALIGVFGTATVQIQNAHGPIQVTQGTVNYGNVNMVQC